MKPPHNPNADVPFPPKPIEVEVEGQSKLASLIEAIADTAVGFVLAVLAQVLIVYMYDLDHISIWNLGILTFWMTVISILRRYMIRRLWNSEFWKRWDRGK